MIDFHRLIFIVIADDLPWPLPRKLGMHFSTLNLPKPMHFRNLNEFLEKYLTNHGIFDMK
jgi:hypothetical protein